MTTQRKRSLSGIKPTGTPHLGNYLGMIEPAIELQDNFDAFYFVADYHALTTVNDPETMRRCVYDITATFLAFGLDPDNAAFFRQSDIPEVTELTWMLSCVTHMGLLQRAHAYKAAKAAGEENEINHGIFSYPVLMASDILIYDSDVVPVGSDQLQHLEMARDMARKFNSAFDGEHLKLPEAKIRDNVATVPGVDGRKMSASYGNVIEPLASPETIKDQVMAIETDSTPLDEPKDPEDSIIVDLYSLVADDADVAEMEDNYRAGGYGYGHAKIELFETIRDHFAPHRERYEELRADEEHLEDVLARGAKRVRPIVNEVMDRVRTAAGLGKAAADLR